jgi:hypothetical protein
MYHVGKGHKVCHGGTGLLLFMDLFSFLSPPFTIGGLWLGVLHLDLIFEIF